MDWLVVRILPTPPRSLSNRKISLRLAKGPQLAGFDVGGSVSAETLFPPGADFGPSVSARGNPVSRKASAKLPMACAGPGHVANRAHVGAILGKSQ
jgi:hypothetical protein